MLLFDTFDHFSNSSHCFCCLDLSQSTNIHKQLSNGFDHYSPANSPTSGGSLSSGSSTAFPFFPPSSSSSSCPTRSWSRPASALLPDFPHNCPMGSPTMPSSHVPSWKVCLEDVLASDQHPILVFLNKKKYCRNKKKKEELCSVYYCFSVAKTKTFLTTLVCVSFQDWAKPGPYDQPMINTLRKKKDKGPPVVMDNNGVAGRESSAQQSLATATLAPAEMPQKVSREERNRTTPAKVTFPYLLVTLPCYLYVLSLTATSSNVFMTPGW